jgi:hypothetical protein
MHTLKTITLALMLIIFSVSGLRAEEISLEQFRDEFVAARKVGDGSKLSQLFIDNPNTAKQLQEMLVHVSKGMGKEAEESRALAESLGRWHQILFNSILGSLPEKQQEEVVLHKVVINLLKC